MKTSTARSSQVFWIAATIGLALATLLGMPSTGSAQASWTVSPSPSPTNNIYYNAGNVGIGTNIPAERLVVSNNSAPLPAGLSGTTLHIGGTDGSYNRFTSDAFGGANSINQRRANNTAASPSALATDDLIGQFSWLGFGSTAYSTARAAIAGNASQTWTDANQGTYLTFFTTLNNTAAPLERIRIDNAGNVGIGTVSPTNLVDAVQSQDGGSILSITNTSSGVSSMAIVNAASDWGALRLQAHSTGRTLTRYGITLSGWGEIVPTAGNGLLIGTGALAKPVVFGTNGSERLRIDSAGNVGIGTAAPGQRLSVFGTIESTSGGFKFPNGTVQTTALGSASDLSSGTLPDARFPATLPASSGVNLTTLSASNLASGTVATARLGSGTASATTFLRGDNTWAVPSGGSQWNNGGSSSISYSTGNVGIGTTIAPSDTLEVNGTLKVSGTGNITAAGTIEGYNIKAKFQDVAEWVPSSERIPAGTVVVLDTTKSNQVISSTQSYDTRVAGVVSEQPGIALGESGEGKVLVATTGRVMVKVDASHGPIHIGDLLVTSTNPGVAMKSEPVDLGGVQLHRPGTIIGKALEPLEKGSGRILVLLSLQ